MCFPVSYAGFFATHNNLFFIFHFFMYTCHRSRMTARVKRHTRPTGAVRIQAVGTGIKYVYLCMQACPYCPETWHLTRCRGNYP